MRAVDARSRASPADGIRLAGHLLDHFAWTPGAVIAGFWPLPGEIDVRPLLLAMLGRGHPVVLPVTPTRGLPLTFSRWRPNEALIAGRFGTRHPSGPAVVPDIVLVPLLAFDRRGRRLGYGAGFYDRTLQALPGALRIGCGFAVQEMDEVPTAVYDAELDAVATECGIMACSRRFIGTV
jgi:5-formyltetrahydrofolate cyclo-ligase